MSQRDPKRIHFVAIGGTGMGSLAGLLKVRGLQVTGSDHALYPPMSIALQDWGIEAQEGFDPEHLVSANPEWVVIGNAVRPDNPEAQAAIEGDYVVRSFSDALYELAMAQKHSVVVSGTHGKTTTTSLLAYLLDAAGLEPSFLVGGISLDFGGSFREGEGDHFVVEGDEYDTVFFDKTPKFLHYHPRTLILTSVEFDHADIYRDLDHVKSAFRTLVEALPEDGTLIAAWDHEHVRDVAAPARCRVIRYGTEEGPNPEAVDWLAHDLRPEADGTRFRLRYGSGLTTEVKMPLHGRFNAENVVAALAASHALGASTNRAVEALPAFQGVKRRQEVRGVEGGVTVIDDFAHHPTAVRGTVSALRARFPDRRLWAVFEPRTNTSRRRIFQDAYAQAFDEADQVLVKRVPEEPIYSATGEVTELFSADELVAALSERKLSARVGETVEDLVRILVDEAGEGDIVLVMSNGAFDGIFEKLLSALRG